MFLEKRQLPGMTLLVVGGMIKLGESAAFFAQTLERTLEEELGHVVLDFSQINYIDSTGLGELVGYLGRFGERKRKVILVQPAERVRKLLEVAGLLSLFPIYDSVDQAVAAEG
ncbi:MAG TPA: STAS domain-containing protein [Thermoanaerobaculia bacterium]|nr:STAS domain-containing protein [Thermoanaerobaculia bacterium]